MMLVNPWGTATHSPHPYFSREHCLPSPAQPCTLLHIPPPSLSYPPQEKNFNQLLLRTGLGGR